MANYYCTARTNYFQVKDMTAFKAWAERLSLEIIGDDDIPNGQVGLLPGPQTDSGSFPTMNPETQEEFNFEEELSKHLADGEVAIVKEAGAEKHRYIYGYAVAINSKGKRVTVNLGDIYRKAERKFKVKVTKAEY